MSRSVLCAIQAGAVLFLVLFPLLTALGPLLTLALSAAAGAGALASLLYGLARLPGPAAPASSLPAAPERAEGHSTTAILPLSSSRREETEEEVNAREVFGPISTAVEDKVKVIPVLIKQLNAVVEHTEKAAADLTESFMSINQQAKEQVRQAEEVCGTLAEEEGEDGQEHVLDRVRSQLDELVANFKDVTKIERENQEAMNRVLEHTRSVREIVSRTSEIADKSKVLSINATIEAARAGEHGRGFSVVAKEFKELARNSEAANEEIRGIIDSVEEETDSLYAATRKGADACEELTRQAEAHIGETLDQIDRTTRQSKEKLQELSGRAEQLAKEISTIVVSIQFQDITRQRIEHVITPLGEFAEELSAMKEELAESGSLAEFQRRDHAAWLEHRYTMAEEKALLRQTMEEAVPAGKGENRDERKSAHS